MNDENAQRIAAALEKLVDKMETQNELMKKLVLKVEDASRQRGPIFPASPHPNAGRR